MTLLGITPGENKANRQKVKRILRQSGALFFILFLATPLVAYGLVQLGIYLKWFPSAEDRNTQIKAPVALLTTNQGTGTAFLVSETKLLTAAHVIAGQDIGDEVQLVFKGANPVKTATAKVIFKGNGGEVSQIADFTEDVAVLELETPIEDIVPLDIGESESVADLDEVLIIGYPGGGDLTTAPGSITSISFQGVNSLFKHNAAANPGNSGGPLLLKSDNTVIGLVNGRLEGYNSPDGSVRIPQGENNAVKIQEVVDYLDANGIDIYE